MRGSTGGQALDEGGVQLACFMVAVGTSLKELLDQSRFLLLQLGDAFTLVGHLLHRTEEENADQSSAVPEASVSRARLSCSKPPHSPKCARMRIPVLSVALAGYLWCLLPRSTVCRPKMQHLHPLVAFVCHGLFPLAGKMRSMSMVPHLVNSWIHAPQQEEYPVAGHGKAPGVAHSPSPG